MSVDGGWCASKAEGSEFDVVAIAKSDTSCPLTKVPEGRKVKQWFGGTVDGAPLGL
jgi:hypothetical protein